MTPSNNTTDNNKATSPATDKETLAASHENNLKGSNLNERWYQSKAFRRFIRSPLAMIGFFLLLFYALVAILAPIITAPQIAERYRGHTCARDMSAPIDSSNWQWYQKTRLPNFSFWDLERVPRGEEGISYFRDPRKAHFWRALLIPPRSCLTIPRVSFSPIPVAPSSEHLMGVASGGYDIFYGIIWGARMAFYVGILVSGISLLLGIIIGGISGFFAGWVDDVLMRFTEVIFAFPNLIAAIVVVTVFGQSLTNALIALSVVGWTGYARIFRGDILKVRRLEYVDSAKALGATNFGIFRKHVFPNAVGSLIILASLDIGTVVLTSSGLAFLGLGAEIGTTDWGQMISFARQFLTGGNSGALQYWYISFYPGLAIVLFVLAWNLLGDAYRDIFDPRNQ